MAGAYKTRLRVWQIDKRQCRKLQSKTYTKICRLLLSSRGIQRLYFLFSGAFSWSTCLWIICPWNKCDEAGDILLQASDVLLYKRVSAGNKFSLCYYNFPWSCFSFLVFSLKKASTMQIFNVYTKNNNISFMTET